MPPGIKKVIQALVLFLALFVIVMVSAFVTMKAATWGRTVSVPDVAGRDLSTAINQLKQSGLGIKVDREEYHPSAPAGSVISQSPMPGSQVKKGRGVSVVVSLGSQEITVPDLGDETFRRAQVTLRQAGLTLGETAKASSELPRDAVIAQEPPGQTVVQKGRELNLLISRGPLIAKFVTPDLTGRTVSEAEAALRPLMAGVNASGKGEVVLSQTPRPGYPVSAGGRVSVMLGAGTAPPGGVQPEPRKGPKPMEPVRIEP